MVAPVVAVPAFGGFEGLSSGFERCVGGVEGVCGGFVGLAVVFVLLGLVGSSVIIFVGGGIWRLFWGRFGGALNRFRRDLIGFREGQMGVKMGFGLGADRLFSVS